MGTIYGEFFGELEQIQDGFVEEIEKIRAKIREELGLDPIEHYLSRIKDEESMREKCRRKGLPVTPESALFEIHDAIGVRIVCAFVDDVYKIREHISKLSGYRVVEEKDYIRQAKENGYRSYHMILCYQEKFFIEVQLRTISMDTWAALEHHLKYKRKVKNEQLIIQELKRCADELASTDISMQTIRDMILEGEEE